MKKHSFAGYMVIRTKDYWRMVHYEKELIDGHRALKKMLDKCRADCARLEKEAANYQATSATDSQHVVQLQGAVNDQAIKIGALELRCRELIQEVQEARKMLYGVPDDLPPEIAAVVDWERMGLKEPKPR